jgi:hypothetical protein
VLDWTELSITVHFDGEVPALPPFDPDSIKYQGKPVLDWFVREYHTTHKSNDRAGEFLEIRGTFDPVQIMEVAGKEYPVKGLTGRALRVIKKKKTWVSWTGESLYNWNLGVIQMPGGWQLTTSPIEMDVNKWDDFDGEMLPIPNNLSGVGDPGLPPPVFKDFPRKDLTDFGIQQVRIEGMIYRFGSWDDSKEVVDLTKL